MRALWENREWRQKEVIGEGGPPQNTSALATPSDQTSNNMRVSYCRVPGETTINGRKKKKKIA